LKNLYQRGQRIVYVVSRKTMDGKSSGVRHQSRSVTVFIFRKTRFPALSRLELFHSRSHRSQLSVFDEVSAPVAATGLLIDPAWNNVFGLTGVLDPVSITHTPLPTPFCNSRSRRCSAQVRYKVHQL